MTAVRAPACLLVPGLGNSGPDHWQTAWERDHGYRRVELGDWDAPDRDRWVARLVAAIAAAPARVLLVAHSLGCLTVAWWAGQAHVDRSARIDGALLVAPPDVERPDAPAEIGSFAPAPRLRLPFPALLVASRNDPYAGLPAQAALAEAWGARLVDVGALGHINAASALGSWAEGHALLDRLRR